MQRPFPNSPAKLRRFFFPAKFSGEKIFRTLNLRQPRLLYPAGHLRPRLACGRTPAGVRFVPESGCKITTFLLTYQIFRELFSGKISQPHRHYERILLLIKILHPIIFFEIKRAHPEICYTSSTGMHRTPPTISQPHHQPTKYSTLHSDKHNKRIKYDLWKFQTQHVAPSATPKQATDNVFSLIFIIFATTTKHGLTITTNKAKLLATRHHGTRPHRYRHRTKGCPPRARRQHTTTVYKGLSTPT